MHTGFKGLLNLTRPNDDFPLYFLLSKHLKGDPVYYEQRFPVHQGSWEQDCSSALVELWAVQIDELFVALRNRPLPVPKQKQWRVLGVGALAFGSGEASASGFTTTRFQK
jgi:hypothetical protein